MRSLEGKVAIVTGGSGGIGSAICERLAVEGAKVVVHYSGHADAANEVVSHIKDKGGDAIAIRANLSTSDEVSKLFNEAQQQFEGLDIVINNAGTGAGGPVAEMDEAAFDKVFNLNAFMRVSVYERSGEATESEWTNCQHLQWSCRTAYGRI